MTQNAIHTENPRASWLAFLASPAAPKRPMSVLELDGYLTGVIVAPTVIPPSLWTAGLWVDEEPVFDNDAPIQSVLGGIGAMLNSLSTSIERSLHRLELERVRDYRPAFQTTDGKPSHEAAAFIPRSVLLLRKIAQLRASRSGSERQTRRDKTGRNDPCPCGSGKKFKRCCYPA